MLSKYKSRLKNKRLLADPGFPGYPPGMVQPYRVCVSAEQRATFGVVFDRGRGIEIPSPGARLLAQRSIQLAQRARRHGAQTARALSVLGLQPRALAGGGAAQRLALAAHVGREPRNLGLETHKTRSDSREAGSTRLQKHSLWGHGVVLVYKAVGRLCVRVRVGH